MLVIAKVGRRLKGYHRGVENAGLQIAARAGMNFHFFLGPIQQVVGHFEIPAESHNAKLDGI